MKSVVCDIETDDLNPSFIWLIVTKDVVTKERKIFKRPDLYPEEFLEYAKGVDVWIGHNFLLFDYKKVLLKFFPELKINRTFPFLIDTLVCSRTFRFDVQGGHSVEAWASRFGLVKPKIDDFTQGLTEDMIVRCCSDVDIQLKLYEYFKKHIHSETYAKALYTEHESAWICDNIKDTGFGFDVEKAKEIRAEIAERVLGLEQIIREAYPPTYVEEVFIPKVNNSTKGYQKGVPFVKRTLQDFNPGSPKQVVEKLNEAGWDPVEKTKGHLNAEKALRLSRDKAERALLKERLEEYKIYGWSVSEDNLATLPDTAPEGTRRLAEWITLNSRVRTLTEWIDLYNPATESIHPTIFHIGSWTQRKSHANPNSANIPGHFAPKDSSSPSPVEQIKLDYNLTLRSLWRAREGRRQIGVDADGIQLRILAHATNDMESVKALVSGSKKDHTDQHSLNALRLGIGYDRRDDAKTFIYAWVLGASVAKIATILKGDSKTAKECVDRFLELNPALKDFKEKQIPAIARQGYFQGIDGRYVLVPDEHRVLAGILQNGESVAMKTANIIWRSKLLELGIPFWQINDVHDEWQVEVPDDESTIQTASEIIADSIRIAGEQLNLRCPLLGSIKIGYNWRDTH